MGIKEDLERLAGEIGPRGACTQSERAAGDYIKERFEKRGLETTTQEFSCIDTYSYLYIIYVLVAIICGVLSRWFPYYVAPLALVNALLFAFDLETFPLLSKLLPHKPSRNVIGEIPSKGGKINMVVTAHYDSARSGLNFDPKMVSSFKVSFCLMIGSVFAVGILSIANMVLKIVNGDTNIWVWIATLVASAYLLGPLAIFIHREARMDYTPGANDNASGVVTMLALVDKVSEPESNLKGMMFVATGAEEVGTAGMIEFLKANGERIKDALIVNLDNLGKGHLFYIDKEGMLFPHDSDPVLIWLASKVVEKKALDLWRTDYRLLSTDATPALARGYKAMSVMAFDEEGLLPNWHWKTDTIENLSIENIEIARAFLWNLAKAIDLQCL
ncbi:MAG: M28 family peptidase [Actinomycetota bacterium]|nr:M28 family peptidase [Actinomycetota bacterium]